MSRILRLSLLAVLALTPVLAAAQQAPLTRDQERERLRSALNRFGPLPEVNTDFRQSDKQPYNFVGVMKTMFVNGQKVPLPNAEYFEVVVGVGETHTISVRVYPHYNGNYMNVKRARDGNTFMRKLLFFSHHNFFYWAADDDDDCYAIFNFTLENGFPDEAFEIVLRSIANNDQFVGQLRPSYDGSTGKEHL